MDKFLVRINLNGGSFFINNKYQIILIVEIMNYFSIV